MPAVPHVVTFDAGQTLVELDLDFLAARLAERGRVVPSAALAAAMPAAWRHHDALVEAGEHHPWQGLMAALIGGAGVPDAGALAEWLFHEQPRRNLFRRPIAGMVALARELAARGVRVAVLSNSEGHLAELLGAIGVADTFAAVIDSGRLGIAKPDPRIFAHALELLGGAPDRAVHVGDSWAADVAGARAAGWRAVWYGGRGAASDGVAIARDAAETRAALAAFGV
ncbi:MAG TPA: HAD family hydrolase [Kofleriaceae bacterium]|nr:HAD family hydrolase [Kofleriaceae bacterium]